MALLRNITGVSSKSSVNKTNKWEDELQSIYDQNINRKKFSYDMNNDPMQKQYAQLYEQNAKLAMDDTVGQVSALTGGYGNSYAQTAGQAVYNQQMSGMNDKALQLYQMALNQYNAEGDRLMQMYGITADQYQTEYNRIRDEVADEQWAKSFDEQQRQYNLGLAMDAAGMAIDVGKFGASMAFDISRAAASDAQWAKSFDYQKERDLVGDAQWQQSFDYQKEQDAIANSQWQQSFDYKKERDGISDAQFQKELDYKYAALDDNDDDDYGDVDYQNGNTPMYTPKWVKNDVQGEPLMQGIANILADGFSNDSDRNAYLDDMFELGSITKEEYNYWKDIVNG